MLPQLYPKYRPNMTRNFCSNCGCQLVANSKFCPNCGNSIETDFSQDASAPFQESEIRQSAYQQHANAQQPKVGKRHNGLGTAGFVLGLIGIMLDLLLLVNSAGAIILAFLGLFLTFLAFLFSLIGVCLRNRRKGLAIVGLILSFIGGAIFVNAGLILLASL